MASSFHRPQSGGNPSSIPSAKPLLSKGSRRAAEKKPRAARARRPQCANLDTPLSSKAAVALLNVLSPEACAPSPSEEAQEKRVVHVSVGADVTSEDVDLRGDVLDLDAAMGRVPQLVSGEHLGRVPMPELLMLGLAGQAGQYSFVSPAAAMADRLARELVALADFAAIGDSDTESLGELLSQASDRAMVLAELLHRLFSQRAEVGR